MRFWAAVLAFCLMLVGLNAQAARLGGRKSIGQQSSNVTQRQAAPTQGAAQSAPPTPTPAAPAPAPKRPWGAMLGGLAAGLGLAWLASSLGLGAGMGQVLMVALLALVLVMALRWLMRSRQSGASQGGTHAPFAFQGAAGVPLATPPHSYRPENVGNDASARPWERSTMGFMASAPAQLGGSTIGSGLSGSQSWGIPAGFDTAGFLKSAKSNFVTLQAAWDRSDIPTLRAMMTDAMLSEIQAQLSEREAHPGGAANATDVQMLDAQLLGIEDRDTEYLASVEFSGMIREEASVGPSPFREVWNMSKSKRGSGGWLVAGVQALQ